MSIYRYSGNAPQIPASAFVAQEATLVGQVVLGEHCSVWFGAVIRGDNEPIHLGDACNVQEGAVLHVDPGFPMEIGANVTIGHQAMLHGCTVGEGSLIGIQAVVLNGAIIGKHCLVGAGAVVTERKTFADRSLIVGAPARFVRELTDAEVAGIAATSANYARRAELFRTGLERIG